MTKKDVIDPALAKRFAWRAEAPESFAEDDDEARHEPPPKPSTRLISPAELERIVRECADFARQIERVWAIATPALQAAATVKLYERAHQMNLHLLGMRAHPLARIRLWRLAVRHLEHLPKRKKRVDLHPLSYAQPAPEEREIIDLIFEVAESGNSWLAFLLEENGTLEAAARRHPSLGACLAKVLDETQSWAIRELVAGWLAYADLRDASPALHRLLRLPHARLRWIALGILLERAPETLGEADVQWLLDDALVHPVPEVHRGRAGEVSRGYADALMAAVEKVRPKEGWRPLEIIVDYGGELIRRRRGVLDVGWALEALAAGYPERALRWIDRELAEGRSHRLYPALVAAGRLPEELARPRLMEAATALEPLVAERARRIWFERFGDECPVDLLSRIPIHLLEEPPGERLHSRLTVLRGASKEAREAMLEVLVGEAPTPAEGALEDPVLTSDQREALALLLYALRQGTPTLGHPRLPTSEADWATLLLERFGDLAFEGLAELALRGGRVGAVHGWQSALATLASQGVLRPAWRERLRAIAVESLRAFAGPDGTGPLEVFLHVGAPLDVLDQLWAIATSTWEQEASKAMLRHSAIVFATKAIVAMPEDAGLDARIRAGAAEAMAARDWERLEKILTIGCERRLNEALALVDILLARVDEDPTLEEMLARLVYVLESIGRIDDAWLLEALEHPESIRFDFATYHIGNNPSPVVLSVLERTLDSPARNGAAAAHAARHLFWINALSAEDPRLDGILERAPLRHRGILLGALVFLKAPLSLFRRYCIDVLAGPDRETAAQLFENLRLRRPEGISELFEAVLSLDPDPEVREAIEYFLDMPSEAELFWLDLSDDEEDEFEGLI